VHVIIRRDALDASMSRYLVDRIERNPGIVVWPSTQVTALTGTSQLEAVRLHRGVQPEASELAVTGLFVFIGAKPGTGWLAVCPAAAASPTRRAWEYQSPAPAEASATHHC